VHGDADSNEIVLRTIRDHVSDRCNVHRDVGEIRLLTRSVWPFRRVRHITVSAPNPSEG
jgi:hypothetical protein